MAPPFPSRPNSARRKALVRELLDWYEANRRDLPWRRTRDPYAIWISEAMLQQTRVETVVDYWTRFLNRFPTAADLAAADEAEVLALWSGLGYYRRARSLHAAARVIAQDHGGRFPRERRSVLALPGVGPYTAGAVLSIAFDQPEALVDGNVERVFSRYFGLDAPAGSSALQRECWELASALVPEVGAGAWNQALMELGATVCTPRSAQCSECPLSRGCRARAADRVDELPGRKPRPAPIDVELEVALVEANGLWLFEVRPEGGRMAGLLEFPTIELGREGETRLWPTQFAAGADLVLGQELGDLRHAITRHRIRGRMVRASARAAPQEPPFRWMAPEDAEREALTGMTRKILKRMPRIGAGLLPLE